VEGSLAAWTNDLMAPPFAGYIFVGHCGAGHASWILLGARVQWPVSSRARIVFRNRSRIYNHHMNAITMTPSCAFNCAQCAYRRTHIIAYTEHISNSYRRRNARSFFARSLYRIFSRDKSQDFYSCVHEHVQYRYPCLTQRGRGRYSFWIHTLSPPPDFELPC